MSTAIAILFLVLSASLFSAAQAADAPPDLGEAIAKEFTGVYRFKLLFVGDGAPYVDIAAHLQFLESDKFEDAPHVNFLNQTGKGGKRGHYNHVFQEKTTS